MSTVLTELGFHHMDERPVKNPIFSSWMHDFFFKFGLIFFLIGIAGWMFLIIPAIIRLFGR